MKEDRILSISKKIALAIESEDLSNEEKVDVLINIFTNLISEELANEILNTKSNPTVDMDSFLYREKIYGVPIELLYEVVCEEE